MRTRDACQADAKAFLKELAAASKPLRSTKAIEVTRVWCKSRGYAEHRGFDVRRPKPWMIAGWVITEKGRRALKDGVPL